MKKQLDKLKNKIKINKTLLIFLTIIVIIGIISGSIFSAILSKNDQKLVTEYITKYISNIKTNKININLKDSIIINIGFITLIWTLGISIIGFFFNNSNIVHKIIYTRFFSRKHFYEL